MKIPDTFDVYERREAIAKLWVDLADQISAEYGIYVSVITKWDATKFGLSEIVFKVGEHEFCSAKELRKALENKAFL